MTPTVIVAASMRGRVSGSAVRELSRRLRRAAQRLGVGREALQTLSVRIVDDAEMSKLHEAHMGLSGPTDVMSFPTSELPGEGAAAGGPLGDVVIDWPAAQRQAQSPQPRDVLEEAISLAVHGLVHLLGHDHGTRTEARAMLRQEQVAARGARLRGLQRPYGGGH